MVMKILFALGLMAYSVTAGSGSSSTPAPTPNPEGTPYNPDNKLFTGDLGAHLATTISNIDQLNAPFSGVFPDSALDDYEIGASECDPELGYLWVPKGGQNRQKPLGLYYTEAGQISGLRIMVHGANAAQGRQIEQGYYVAQGNDEWHMSISFRAPSEMCSSQSSEFDLGDRIVINQHTIAKSIPMTLEDAREANFLPGSCMQSMGQHWFYDLQDAPANSWVSGNLLPVTPMYHPETNKLNAFFWSSPVIQGPDNTGADTKHSWDNVPGILGGGLPAFAMCNNFCAEHCSTSVMGANPWKSSGTTHWATLHVFFNSDPNNEPKCPGYSTLKNLLDPAALASGRDCPDNTAVPTNLVARIETGPSTSDSDDDSASTALVVVLLVAVAVGLVGGGVWYGRHTHSNPPRDVMEVQHLQQPVQGQQAGSSYNAVNAI